MLDIIIERHKGTPISDLLFIVLEELYLLNIKIDKIMNLKDDLSAQLDRISAAQTDAATQNATISAEIKTLISQIGVTPGISADDAASLIAKATTIADASEAVDAALKGTSAEGANTPPPAIVDPAATV